MGKVNELWCERRFAEAIFLNLFLTRKGDGFWRFRHQKNAAVGLENAATRRSGGRIGLLFLFFSRGGAGLRRALAATYTSLNAACLV